MPDKEADLACGEDRVVGLSLEEIRRRSIENNPRSPPKIVQLVNCDDQLFCLTDAGRVFVLQGNSTCGRKWLQVTLEGVE